MTTNAEARLAEARDHVWLGEVAALEDSLTHLRRRRTEAEARRHHSIGGCGSNGVFGPTRRAKIRRDGHCE